VVNRELTGDARLRADVQALASPSESPVMHFGRIARVGPEAVVDRHIAPGDRIQVEYLVGVAVRVSLLKDNSGES